jgi:hypothetical protein
MLKTFIVLSLILVKSSHIENAPFAIFARFFIFGELPKDLTVFIPVFVDFNLMVGASITFHRLDLTQELRRKISTIALKEHDFIPAARQEGIASASPYLTLVLLKRGFKTGVHFHLVAILELGLKFFCLRHF